MTDILAICGSLRKESFNLKLLKSFHELLPGDLSLEIVLLHDIPLFNEDVEALGVPPVVQAMADKVLKAKILLFACPEYNYSIPGVLKNAIDWLSRHPNKPLSKKTAVMMGASQGLFGTARAQYHLRQVAVFVDLRFINKPEIMVARAHTKFDEEGRLTDPETTKHLLTMAEAVKDLLAEISGS